MFRRNGSGGGGGGGGGKGGGHNHQTRKLFYFQFVKTNLYTLFDLSYGFIMWK